MASKTMNPSPATRMHPPQAFSSTYAPRIRTYGNPLLTPIVQPATVIAPLRTTKRGTTSINYADDGFDDDDFEDGEGSRRPTGLRSLRRDPDQPGTEKARESQIGREVDTPIHMLGIWREWMGKVRMNKILTEKQHQVQCTLPLTLVPIRIDLDIPSFRPEAPLPVPAGNARDFGIDEALPSYVRPEPTPAYRLKDAFLWNLHEALTTPDTFAKILVEELDLPPEKRHGYISTIAGQIREQLEQYAGIALHPLFDPAKSNSAPNGNVQANPVPSRAGTPLQIEAPTQPNGVSNGIKDSTDPRDSVNAVASQSQLPSVSDVHNPNDTYRCIISLSINLLNRLYTDRFEWSLVHPPGLAEVFAKQTAADLGLASEWAAAIAHAIYEAVLRLKKEVCENGGLIGVGGYGGEVDNEAAWGDAGWRYDHDGVGAVGERWEPRLELLSKEEIEKREGDRERQLRRVRRETARYSSTATLGASTGGQDYFNQAQDADQPMGRGERSKKKRRFRSLSPLGRDTPDAKDAAGYGGGVALSDAERQSWRCSHCGVWGLAVWAVRDGPNGPKSLCHNCGFLYERDKKLPPWSQGLFVPEGVSMAAKR